MGALSGLLTALLLKIKIRLRNAAVDGILGSVGFVIAWFAVVLIPWRNTITYYVGKTLVTSTMNHYQHPDLVAYSAAALLPILHELGRFKRAG